MKKIAIETVCKPMLADVYTPVGIYLRLRDRFRDRRSRGTSCQEKGHDQNAIHRKLVLTVLRSATLQRVDDGLALVLGGLEAVGVLAVDEQASDETDEEAGDE
jgi:hypothetical protein